MDLFLIGLMFGFAVGIVVGSVGVYLAAKGAFK